MNKCRSFTTKEVYDASLGKTKEVGYCLSTKECDLCDCGGDPSKCDFYESKRKEGNKMTTAEMIAEAVKDGATYVSERYCSGGLWYSFKNGFRHDNGYSLKEINDFSYFMCLDDWTKVEEPIMTIEEAEKKFNIKIIG